MQRLLLLLTAFVLCGAACAARAGAPQETAIPMVILRPPGRPEVRVRVEVARSPDEKARGLMYRDRLAPEEGMLFLFDQEEPHPFWMKNTYIALDMIFITKQRTVLGVVENAEPLTLTERSVPGLSMFVLEVVGGFAARHGVGPQTPVELLHVD
jgi:uncharacterized membrane protein (UPF0127 family)